MTWVNFWALELVVLDCEKQDCRRVDLSLGFTKMPTGYALMLDAEQMYFFWVRFDGKESCVHWNKWAVYHGAKFDSEKPWNNLGITRFVLVEV